MAPQERTALQVGSIGMRADAEVCTEHASSVLEPFLQRESELLAKEKLQPKGIPEGPCRKQFPDIPLALPPSQFSSETWCNADHKRPSVNEVSFCVIEDEYKAREFCHEAAQQATDPIGQRMFDTALCAVPLAQYGCVATQDNVSRGGPPSRRACPSGQSDLGG
jgi:hypothetical protein